MNKIWLQRNFQWLSVLFAVLSPLFFSIYCSLYFEARARLQSIDFLAASKELGWLNLLLFIGVLTLIFHVILSFNFSNLKKELAEKSTKNLINSILKSTINSITLNLADSQIYIRSVVMLHDVNKKERYTYCGVNIGPDSERYITIPEDFGISGKAFRLGRVYGENLEENHNASYDENLRDKIWSDLRSVIAAPLVDSKMKKFGTVNFDSSGSLSDTNFDSREFQELLHNLSNTISELIENTEKMYD